MSDGRLMEALRFYADISNWMGPIYDRHSGEPTYTLASTNTAVNQDHGTLAREALAEFGGRADEEGSDADAR